MVNAIIDGRAVSVQAGTTILDAARSAGIPIPHLCYLKGINEIAACRMCVVEVEGIERLVTACDNVVLEGMVISTNSPRVRRARRPHQPLLHRPPHTPSTLYPQRQVRAPDPLTGAEFPLPALCRQA